MIINIILAVVAIFLSLIIHEIAHGYVALQQGDNTAKTQGRLSLNLFKHIDIFGTILLPLLLFFSKIGFIFGWAKPVPINYSKLKTKKSLFMVSVAGVVANATLVIIFSILLKLIILFPNSFTSGTIAMFCFQMIFINIILIIFNLLPIPPLDGSKIFLIWFDNYWIKKYLSLENKGLYILIAFIFILPSILYIFNINFNPLVFMIKKITIWIMQLIV